jgi:hypothetical protein
MTIRITKHWEIWSTPYSFIKVPPHISWFCILNSKESQYRTR